MYVLTRTEVTLIRTRAAFERASLPSLVRSPQLLPFSSLSPLSARSL